MDDQRQFPGYFSYIVKSILFVRKTGMPGETQGSAASHWRMLSNKVVSNTPYHGTDPTNCVILYSMSVYGLPVLTEIIAIMT